MRNSRLLIPVAADLQGGTLALHSLARLLIGLFE
jgi:hypothetical protein